jgi:uncharacterized MAPEG superfamily protein
MDMTPEFMALTGVLVLAVIQILWAAVARTSELGVAWNAGPRDDAVPPPGKLAGRLIRAQANLFETLPIFATLVIMSYVTGHDGALTALGAHLYFFGRLIYLPLYVFGVPFVRSLVWLVSLAGLLMVLAALFI